MSQLDHALFQMLNRGSANSMFDWLMPRITNLHHQGWFLAFVALLCVYLLWRGPRRARAWAMCALVAVGLSDVASARLIKPLIPRLRPCARAAPDAPPQVPGVRLLSGRPGPLRIGDPRDCPGSRSFPSNHAANMAALATVGWWFTRRRTRWFWLLLPLLIGYSRIYLGYHYPSDVLGGWVLGVLLALAVLYAARPFYAPPLLGTPEASARSSS